ncbi:BamA/TamA family outer membrane protein [Shewanella sp. Scap07]|uniref:BamA/TamA family outer membrane protein n=1 Tax=Shewanella sp. Scap07 TaxID=2589987 RepID=UPI0015BA79D8|nr:BamA/TamA family outer membrane protein [Shewanella sp. Scap07]
MAIKQLGLLLTLMSAPIASAMAISFTDPLDGQFDMGEYLAENAYGFLPVPILLTEPALGIGGGVAGVFLHENEQEKQQRQQQAAQRLDGGANLMTPAITVVGGAGTDNGTWIGFAGHRHSWLNDSIRYTGLGGYGKANLAIYSDLGGLMPPENAIGFDTTTEGFLAVQHLQFRVAKTQLMLGVKQSYSQSSVSSSNALVDLLLQRYLGDATAQSAIGLTAEFDQRDNHFFPKDGYLIDAQYMAYRQSFGSDENYDTAEVNAEYYLPVNQRWTVAFAGSYQGLYSDNQQLPPTVRPYVKLRGAPAYRYQGDEVLTAQAQLMYHINHRWLVSAFYGQGHTKEQTNLGSSAQTISAYGSGFRYQIARRYGLHMGIDVARSDEDSAIYFQIGSGF